MADDSLIRGRIYDMFAKTADRWGSEPFLLFEGTEWTYGEASEAVDRRAALLAELGVESGDRVGILFPNDPEFPFLFFAIQKLGAVAVTLDYRQEDAVLEYLLSDADPALVAVDAVAYDAVHAAFGSCDDGATVLTHDVGDPAHGDVDLDGALDDLSSWQWVDRAQGGTARWPS